MSMHGKIISLFECWLGLSELYYIVAVTSIGARLILLLLAFLTHLTVFDFLTLGPSVFNFIVVFVRFNLLCLSRSALVAPLDCLSPEFPPS